MQNTTNQPQTFYTKPGTPDPAGQMQPINEQPPASPRKATNSKSRQIFAVAGLVLFAIVAGMGVMIAQRQISKPGQDTTLVAPNAPESRPAASTYEPNNCATQFFVPFPEAVCDTKTALSDYTTNNGKPIPSGGKFNVGDEFIFSILVNQNAAGVAKDVRVVDVLPNSLSFVSAANNTRYTLTNNGQTVTATIPQMQANSSVRVEFKVKVNSGNYGQHTNKATIADTQNQPAPGACTYNFSTVQGITECVDKEMYTLQGRLVTNGGALTRGQQYEYRITAKATNRSLGDVKVHDVIPEDLEYVRPATGSEEYIVNDPESGILIANLGVLEDEEATIGFIVEVPDSIEPTEITNTALVYAFPKDSRPPEPPANADKCSVTHTILPIGTAECVEKEAFTNFGGTKIVSGSEVAPGSEFIYKVTVAAKQTTNGSVSIVDQLPRDLTFIEDPGNTAGLTYNSATREVRADLGTMQSGTTKSVEFKVQLAANPQSDTFNNVATIFTDSETKHVCELPLKVEKDYSCNSECETNANCSEAGSGYICYNTGSGKFCRLGENPTNTSCVLPTPAPTPQVGCNDTCSSNADCMNDAHICVATGTGNRCRLAEYVSSSTCTMPNATPAPTPIPTPAPGCNDTCTQNADCKDSSHICSTTADGSNRCRLAQYPDATNCTAPAVTNPVAQQQPVLPAELPQSGPADWLNWLKAGLVTLGIGTALFLLL